MGTSSERVEAEVSRPWVGSEHAGGGEKRARMFISDFCPRRRIEVSETSLETLITPVSTPSQQLLKK